MSSVLKKIFDYISTDGLKNTITMILRSLSRQLGLSISETYFYRLEIRKKAISGDSVDYVTGESKFLFHVITEKEGLRQFNIMSRFNYLPIEKWFKNGSKCYLFSSNKDIIVYVWAHINEHDIGNKKIYLKTGDVWTGPSFVRHQYRGKELYKLIMCRQIECLKSDGTKNIFTCNNAKAIAPTKILIKNNFDIIGVVRERKFFKIANKKQVIDFTKDGILSERLK